MKKMITSACLLLLLSGYTYAQDTTKLKRTPYKLSVAVDRKAVYEEDLPERPYIMPDNTIQLYPGEKLFVEVEQENGIIKSMTAVKAIKNPAKTITIRFTQVSSKKVHQSMMLEVQNPFAFTLTYKCFMNLLQQKKWVETNVYPVEPGLTGFETWPDIIITIGLGGWALQKK